MKKADFPTFLNEQPTVVFGRTTRELLILAVGLAVGYLCWQRITIPGDLVLSVILRIVCAAIVTLLAVIVAFMKVATRPLEEWAVVGFSYLVLPKIYLYLPPEENEPEEQRQSDHEELLGLGTLTDDDEDRYN